MIVNIITIVMELSSLGLVIAAGGLWAGASISTRPKYKDEQTMIGGSIWSQIIIPIGLLISMIVEEPLDDLVLGYFLLSGSVLMLIAAFGVISNEVKMMRRTQPAQGTGASTNTLDIARADIIKMQEDRLKTAKGKQKQSIPLINPPNQDSNVATQSYDRTYFGIGLLLLAAAVIKFLEFILIIIF